VTVENAGELATIPDVSGLFVGRAALEVGGLLAIAETIHAVLATDREEHA
jgi:triosephosphate isomerase